MSGSAQREARFLAVLEAAEDYLRCQHELASVMRAGFFSLARARYQMGSGKVGPSQYPAIMQATRRVQRSGPTPRHAQDAAVSRTGDTHSDLNDSGHSLTTKASHVQAAEFSSSLIADLASRYAGTGLSDGGSHPDRSAEQGQPQQQQKPSPLQWFGVMVSPHLRQTAADFTAAVTAVEKLAAAQQKLCTLLAK